ncbi:hypothetical protein HHI36_013127 [Cryptolaemus montrouzieri]|uniref:Uncharacterized protein n=1 Tax=Cryptolaemus montrouzieri TaxID=559131 RepID=A0ABD2NGE3_9CUCU
MSHSKEMLKSVNVIISLIQEQVADVLSIGDSVDLVYAAAAVTIHEAMPIPKLPQRSHESAPWRLRLEGKFVDMRKKIGIIHTHLYSNQLFKKLCRSVQVVASEFCIKAKDPSFNDKMKRICDRLKQKIKALGFSMKCWVCRSDLDIPCGDPFDNKTLPITDCNLVQHGTYSTVRTRGCLKTTEIVDGVKNVIRECDFSGMEEIKDDNLCYEN